MTSPNRCTGIVNDKVCCLAEGHDGECIAFESLNKSERDMIDHPIHYGGADNPYEAIKVIEAWGLGFSLGNCLKYLARAGKKLDRLEDLKKGRWYLDREVSNLENPPPWIK